MIIGRERELATLEKLYKEEVFQMVVLYGRRRIGKTTLISAFIADKPAIFFSAQEANDTFNLNLFSRKIYEFFSMPVSAGAFVDWPSAFDFLKEKAATQQFILAFDEFPYAAAANRSLKSILQAAIDHGFKNSRLFLILCGSQIGFMENEVLGYKSPLFGRRTAQMRLAGFDYYDAGKMLAGFSNKDKLKLYACVGGTPHYLAQVKASESFKDNIKRLFFDVSGYLYSEPMMLLRQELREPAMYNSITAAIASGASRLNEIATKIGEDSPKVSKYLQTLVNLQIIDKTYPFGDNPQNSRRGIYRIADHCYLFWFRFVFPHIQEIESGNGSLVAASEVFGERMSTYVGNPPFETICRQYLQRLNRNQALPFTATSFGSWWGNDPHEKAQTDIDVIAANRSTGQILIGECKWRNDVNLIAETEKLLGKDHLLPEYQERYYHIFVKSPPKKKLPLTNVTVVSVDDLFEN